MAREKAVEVKGGQIESDIERRAVDLMQTYLPSESLGAIPAAQKEVVSKALYALARKAAEEEQKAAEAERGKAEAERKAETDSMTGLLNRDAFYKRFDKTFEGENRRSRFMLLIDVDHLKRINKVAGLEGGDAAIMGITNIFKSFLKSGDLCARRSGDEFYIMFSSATSSEDVKSTVLKIADKISKIKINKYDRKIGISVGCVEIPPGDTTPPKDVVRFAEYACDMAKISGRNSYALISPKTHVNGGGVEVKEEDPKVNFQTYSLTATKTGEAHYLAGESGSIEKSRTSRDACKFDVMGSLDRVYMEIELAYNGQLSQLLDHYKVGRKEQLNPEQLELILFNIRNPDAANQIVPEL